MLIIRNAQIEAFRQEKLNQFRSYACSQLRQYEVGRDVLQLHSIEELQNIVDEGMGAAADFGFCTQSQMMSFIKCVWLHGARFYQCNARANRVLRDGALSLEEKLTLLEFGDSR